MLEAYKNLFYVAFIGRLFPIEIFAMAVRDETYYLFVFFPWGGGTLQTSLSQPR